MSNAESGGPEPLRKPRQRGPGPIFGAAFGAWMMSNVRGEIAAGRLRQTIDERGDAATIH
jgi:hypothetical protein